MHVPVMANTLDLDPEWGPIDLIEEVEAAFDIKFVEEDEMAELWTVGDLYDPICTHTPGWDDQQGLCASSVTFYRIRRALASTDKRTISPATKLDLGEQTPDQFFKSLARDSGLRLPALQLTTLSAVGLIAFLLGITVIIAALFEPMWTLAAIGAGVTAAGLLLMKLDPCRVPDGIETVGDLVKRTVPLNVKQLAEDGVRPPDRWSILLALVQKYSSLPKEDIGPDTFLLRKGMKMANA